MARSEEAQLLERGKWKRISIGEALRIRRHGHGFRCIEPVRHEPVRPHKRARNGAAAHFEHLEWNPECPRRQRRPL